MGLSPTATPQQGQTAQKQQGQGCWLGDIREVVKVQSTSAYHMPMGFGRNKKGAMGAP